MKCVMCDHEIDPDVCGYIVEVVNDEPKGFCHGDDHDCLKHYNQAGLYGYPDTTDAEVEGEPHLLTRERRLSGELPAMSPSEFEVRMQRKVAELQAMFPGTRIVLGTAAPLEDTSA